MKKIFTLALALMMTFSIAAAGGCAQKEPAAQPETTQPTADTEELTYNGLTVEQLKASKPNEYIKEKLEAGLEPLIFFGAPLLTDSLMVMINDGLCADIEAMGFSYTYGDCEGNFARMVDMVENAVTMGASAIIIMGFVDGTGDACAQAMEAGTSVFTLAAEPDFEVSGKVSVDPHTQGAAAVDMISAWIDQRYPDAGEGEIKAMVTVSYQTALAAGRSEAYMEGLAADKRIQLIHTATEVATSIDEGFTFAQEAFTIDSDIRVILTGSCAAAVGANNYVVANCGDRLDQMGIFCSTQDPTVLELIEKGAENDASCLRGTIAQGIEKVWESMIQCVQDVLIDGAAPGYIKYDRLYSVNNFGYFYDTAA